MRILASPTAGGARTEDGRTPGRPAPCGNGHGGHVAAGDGEGFPVVALGIANVGKSTTLSAIAGDRSVFAARDVPRATRSLAVHRAGPLLLVDTPGLDADAQDTRLALGACAGAGIVLFCHSLRMGELRPREIEALRAYAGSSELFRRTCFVLTHADDLADDTIARTVSEVIADQLRSVFRVPFVAPGAPYAVLPDGAPPPRRLKMVANDRYWRAQALNGPAGRALAEMSGVPALRRLLLQIAERRAGRTERRQVHP